jgi:hypothetical protein
MLLQLLFGEDEVCQSALKLAVTSRTCQPFTLTLNDGWPLTAHPDPLLLN